MPVFRKKPVEIEAIHFAVGVSHNKPIAAEYALSGDCFEGAEEERNVAQQVQDFLASGGADFECVNDAVDGPCILINTLEGQMKAIPGDWIIKGVKGEFYPCKPDIFEATYDLVTP